VCIYMHRAKAVMNDHGADAIDSEVDLIAIECPTTKINRSVFSLKIN